MSKLKEKCSACCDNVVCNRCFPYRGCGCGLCAFLAAAIVVTLFITVQGWMVALGGIVGPDFQLGTESAFKSGAASGDFSTVQSLYDQNLFLDHSAVIMGTNETGPMGGFVATRGWSESIKVDIDKKRRIASGSKWVSATIIYAVIEHPETNLTSASRPGEYFPFWTCTDSEDIRCNNITLDNLLAFRSGLERFDCEYGGPTGEDWEACVESIFNQPYQANRFRQFEYGPVGLAIGGLMALKEMQKVSGFETANWDDLLQVFILDKAGIQPALFDPERHNNGNMTYDDLSFTGGTYNPDFPGLSGTMACSPRQYAQFAHAFLANKLVSEAAVTEMTRSRGGVDAYFGIDLPAYKGYCQGMWSLGESKTHSVGYFGFYPFLDRSDPDPALWYFGVVAVDNLETWNHHMLYIAGVLVPFFVIIFSFCCFKAYRHRADELDELARPIIGGDALGTVPPVKYSL